MITISKKEIKILHSLKCSLGVSVLYDLCASYFKHTVADVILAKVMLIGRVYAVSLDRGKDKNKTEEQKESKFINDDFYQKEVIPIFFNPLLDNHLNNLKIVNFPNEKNINDILLVHHFLTNELVKLNGQDKRSFSSKYLHFHLPNLFFIYDSRVKSVINDYIKINDIEFSLIEHVDNEYASFYLKSFFLQKRIYNETGIILTPRQLDKFLLEAGNARLRKKFVGKVK